jgi:hypothetical protein
MFQKKNPAFFQAAGLSLQVCFTDAARVAEWAVCHSDGFIVGALSDGDTCAHHVKLVLKAEIHG